MRATVTPAHRTPQHRTAHTELHEILSSLAYAGLPIDASAHPASPSSRVKSVANSVNGLVRFLYFQNKNDLDRIVDLYVRKLQEGILSPQEGLTRIQADLQCARDAKINSPNLLDKFKSIDLDTPKANGRHTAMASTQSHSTIDDDFDVASSIASSSEYESAEEDAPPFLVTANTSFATTISTSPAPPAPNGDAIVPALMPSQQETEYGSSIGVDDLSTLDTVLKSKISEYRPRDEGDVPGLLTVPAIQTSTDDHQRVNATVTRLRTANISHLLKNLPSEQFIDFDMPSAFYNLDFATRYLIYRACTNDYTLIDSFRKQFELHSKDQRLDEQIETMLLSAGITAGEIFRQSEQIIMGSIAVQPKPHARKLLTFSPLPPPSDRLARLEKKFGPQRFMTVTIELPSKDDLSHLSGRNAIETFMTVFGTFLQRPQFVLGTTFQLFQLEQADKQENSKRRKRADSTKNIKRYRLRYFATSGAGMDEPHTIFRLLDWGLALNQNLDKQIHKLLARLDLSLSRTDSTIVFTPDQIRLRAGGTTIYADGSREASEFNDDNLRFCDIFDPSEIMNDGCCRISPAAARYICQHLRLESPWPVAFQARINGAKGMWTIASPYGTHDEDIWIEINETQLKVEPNPQDCLPATCESDKWTFEVVSKSGPSSNSFLYLDFLAILEARGVPRAIIIEAVKSSLEQELEDVLVRLDSPEALSVWVEEKFGRKEMKDQKAVEDLAGFPKWELDRVMLMLETGFSPKSCQTLGELIANLIKFWLGDALQRLKFESDKTVMPYGIADPTGTLEPGEICLTFSSARGDKDTGACVSDLQCEVLVARQPALRESDIQRVKAVYKPELSHLKDIVIFSSRGCIPLAKKLQGGDYDGDKFWVCWDQRLVQSFKNAPMPASPSPRAYGIFQDKTRLSQLWNGIGDQSERAQVLLNKAISIAQEENMLGVVTNLHKKLAYQTGSLANEKVQHLANIHDLVIDSKKNGYLWGFAEYAACMKRLGIPTNLPDAAYEQALKQPLGHNEYAGPFKSLLDELFCQHILPKAKAFYNEVKSLLLDETQKAPDPSLVQPYLDLKDDALNCSVARANVPHLDKQVASIAAKWASLASRPKPPGLEDSSNEAYLQAALACHAAYKAIIPVLAPEAAGDKRTRDRSSLLTDSWLDKTPRSAFSKWELVRASALYHYRATGRGTGPKLAFLMAGYELCWLKAGSGPGWRVLCAPMYAICGKKERKVRRQGGMRGREVEGKSD